MLELHTDIKAVPVNKKPDRIQDYWKNQLAGAPERIEFATIHPTATTSTSKSALLQFSLPELHINKLHFVGSQYDTNLSAILLTAFKILLFRHTNQTDLVVGYAAMEGNTDDCRLIKNTGKFLPVRTNLAENPSFIELLQKVQTVVDAAIHQKEAIELWPKTPVQVNDKTFYFSPTVAFAFNNTAKPALGRNSVPENTCRNCNPAAEIDLTLTLEKSTDGINGVIEYNATLFEAETISGMIERYQVLLEEIISNPAQRIANIRILKESELNKLLFKWNNTNAVFPQDKCIHELFEAQVKIAPQAIAAVLHPGIRKFQDTSATQLTYGELNEKANQVAHYLQSQGVGPDVLVGIYMKRSLEMVIAILGILKAGGAYLPLDAGQPKNRLDFILKDSGITILLTQYLLLNKLPAYETQVVCVDAEWNKIAPYKDETPDNRMTPKNLAYVIYTSGSTGMPKGTLIEHRSVVNYLSWCIKAYRLGEGTGCPVNSSIGFDATVTSFLSPLLAGKKIILLPEDGEIEALKDVLTQENKFSLVKLTPAHLQILSNLLPANDSDGQTNALVIGGEALIGKSLNFWRKHAPATRLINEYGPTETVVGCCIYEVPQGESLSGDIPIGRPIANTQIYILDSCMQPVPTGVAGEIYIGGAGLARGYLNRPQLTLNRFIANPFSTDQNARLYKTGDMARYLNDGNIIFLGRADNQVKIRGYRIELGEVEHVLQQHESVKQAVVRVHANKDGDKRLVGYYVPDAVALPLKEDELHDRQQTNRNELCETECSDELKINNSSFNDIRDELQKDIRKVLLSRLPEYMVPSELIAMHQLPLTTNGKVDYAALPVPGQQRQDSQKVMVAGRNKTEIQLAELFEKSLGIQNISIKDDVFELGFNSLQAYSLFAQIKKLTGVQLPLAILIKAPTIEQLAVYVTDEEANLPWSSLVPIQPKGSKPPLYLVHAGAGTVLFYRELSNCLGEDQPVYGLQPKGLDGKQNFHKNVEEMAQHYVNEIRAANPAGPYLIGGYCFGAVVAFEMAQLLISQGHKVSLLANFNGVSPTYDERFDNSNSKIDTNKIQQYLKPVTEVHSRFTWKLLAQKSNREKFRYLSDKIRNRLSNKLFHGSMMLSFLLYKFYQATGLRAPEKLRKQYWYSNATMVKMYKPKPYPGTLTVFRSPGIYHDPHLGWSNFVTGNIITCDIPGYHINRRYILKEPFVELTAKELTACIDKTLI